ncbi:glutathione S-transferase L3-like isoform X2 [Diospyros lotus]|uniref:glutathione S-transferase L3-like isoform X2 n=1 Tax=Diospyros lotus TaxID=55363 RepID=UPI0022510445|nr:glutathione S-transferase L3-like isoform X2 [Diospyros lotus]
MALRAVARWRRILGPSAFSDAFTNPNPYNKANGGIMLAVRSNARSCWNVTALHRPFRVKTTHRSRSTSTVASASMKDDLPPVLDSSSDPPPLFDGTTRLYIAYICPFAQRPWIARNYKGLQDKIKLVAIDLLNKPTWYKEKVNPENKDPVKHKFAEELLSYSDTMSKIVFSSFKGDPVKEVGSTFDHLEEALHKFDDGPFFLGQFSLVDIAYITLTERFYPFLQEVWKYDLTSGRPKLAAWIEEMNKIDAYAQTKQDPKVIVEIYKNLFLSQK